MCTQRREDSVARHALGWCVQPGWFRRRPGGGVIVHQAPDWCHWHCPGTRVAPERRAVGLCFPKRMRVPAQLLWRPFDVAPEPLALPSTASSSHDVARVPIALPAPREPRTRAEHRAAASASATATTHASRGSALDGAHAAAAADAPRVLGRTRAETRRLAALANGGRPA